MRRTWWLPLMYYWIPPWLNVRNNLKSIVLFSIRQICCLTTKRCIRLVSHKFVVLCSQLIPDLLSNDRDGRSKGYWFVWKTAKVCPRFAGNEGIEDLGNQIKDQAVVSSQASKVVLLPKTVFRFLTAVIWHAMGSFTAGVYFFSKLGETSLSSLTEAAAYCSKFDNNY